MAKVESFNSGMDTEMWKLLIAYLKTPVKVSFESKQFDVFTSVNKNIEKHIHYTKEYFLGVVALYVN